MAKRLIGGNFKMNKSNADLDVYFQSFLAKYTPSDNLDVTIAPQMASLSYVSKYFEATNLHLGSQTMSRADSGTFTGEVSPLLLREIGVNYVIVGHSERRTILGETDAMVNKKMVACLQHGLRPILCVGETMQQKESNLTESIVESQLKAGLAGITDLSLVDVAYEPLWAISTGLNQAKIIPTNEEIEKIHGFIRKFVSPTSRILYGGSSDDNNAGGLITIPNVDGFLVGGASLDPNKFLKMIEAIS